MYTAYKPFLCVCVCVYVCVFMYVRVCSYFVTIFGRGNMKRMVYHIFQVLRFLIFRTTLREKNVLKSALVSDATDTVRQKREPCCL